MTRLSAISSAMHRNSTGQKEGQMETLKVSPQRLTGSLGKLPSSTGRHQVSTEHLTYAAERARMLFGCYRKAEANDPDIYVAAIAAILAEYGPEVIRTVTDPREGIARKSKWMPSVAELDEECKIVRKFVEETLPYMQAKGWSWDGQHWWKNSQKVPTE